jgi:hypothetical protein
VGLKLLAAQDAAGNGPGAVQIEVWALAPGRFLKSEWKPWLVPSPIWVYPGETEREEADSDASHPPRSVGVSTPPVSRRRP